MLKYKLHVKRIAQNIPIHFWVTQIGKNGKVLNTSEMLDTKQSAIKNVKASADGREYKLIDLTK